MYLSLMKPEVLPVVAVLGRGLWVTNGPDGPVLLVKVVKEFIRAAKEKRELKMYLAPYESGDLKGLTILTACFDNPQSPLLIATPLLGQDELSLSLKNFPDDFSICFFDEHNRELLSCTARASFQELRDRLGSLAPLDNQHWHSMSDQAHAWFSLTTYTHDARAIKIELLEDLFPSDFFITDFTRQDFQGSAGYSNTELERPEPGPMQEVDIIYLLQRAYPAKNIIHGPLKVSDREELVDVLVLGDEVNLILQAKDSPNTAKTVDTSLDRKRAKSISQLKEALGQLKGTLSTIRNGGNLPLKLSNGSPLDINLTQKPLVGVVVVRELFSDSYDVYGEMILAFMDKHLIRVVAFDYNEFEVMTRHCPSEPALLSAFFQISEYARTQRIYPKLRFKELPPR